MIDSTNQSEIKYRFNYVYEGDVVTFVLSNPKLKPETDFARIVDGDCSLSCKQNVSCSDTDCTQYVPAFDPFWILLSKVTDFGSCEGNGTLWNQAFDITFFDTGTTVNTTLCVSGDNVPSSIAFYPDGQGEPIMIHLTHWNTNVPDSSYFVIPSDCKCPQPVFDTFYEVPY